MKNITHEMLETLIQKLQSGRQPVPPTNATNSMGLSGSPINTPMDDITKALMGKLQPPTESTTEIEKLNNALSFLSSDVERGSGQFYTSNEKPKPDHWLAGIWAIASLGWASGKETARKWSQTSSRYTDDGFEQAWNSYNPAHENGIGIGSLYKRAKELGWNQTITASSAETSPQRFTLLGINDLAALPPTEHLVKGVSSQALAWLQSMALAAQGKTFLALDLIMAIACQADWFGHKVKNAPVDLCRP
jgi:hypothetical protein